MISSPHLSMAYFYLLVLMPVLSSCQELFFLLEPALFRADGERGPFFPGGRKTSEAYLKALVKCYNRTTASKSRRVEIHWWLGHRKGSYPGS